MKYTSRSTRTVTTVTKEFDLIDAPERNRSKTITYRPTLLRVVYDINDGNARVGTARISGPRILKSGEEGLRVDETLYTWECRDDASLAPYEKIIQANLPHTFTRVA